MKSTIILFLIIAGVSIFYGSMQKKRPLVPADKIVNCSHVEKDKAPKAIGPYSQAIEIDNTLYLAGQIGLDPSTGKLVAGGVSEQTNRVMKNLEAVLDAAGYRFDNVVQTQVFVADLNDYKAMNDVYAKYFSDAPPARAAVQAVLPRGALVEIMMVAKR